MTRREWPLLVAIFLDLLGFGLLIPDLQFRAEKMGASGPWIGAILASTFVIQFIVSPRWGVLSDRIGRKPVLVICSCLSAGGMLVYGLSSNLWILLGSRVLAGFGAANVAVAQAYIADASTPEARTASMGRVSAAISLGLIIGPSLLTVLARYGIQAVGFAAAIASGLGVLLILFVLPGVAPKEKRPVGTRPIIDLTLLRDFPRLAPLVTITVVAWFSLATLEGTFGRLIERTLGLGQEAFGWIFSYESLLAVIVQGFLIVWVSKRIKEGPLLSIAYLMQGLGLALTPYAPTLAILFAASTCYALGTGFASPTIYGLCSKIAPEDRQGELFGILQSARSFGFVAGPIVGGSLFDWRPEAPYLLAGVACIAAALLVSRLRFVPTAGTAQAPDAGV